jgi:hypothetical protein
MLESAICLITCNVDISIEIMFLQVNKFLPLNKVPLISQISSFKIINNVESADGVKEVWSGSNES